MLLELLTLPVLGGPQLVHWLAGKVAEGAERELLDDGPVRAALLELQARYDLGEVQEADYDEQERALLERLKLGGLIAGSPRLYDGVADMMRSFGEY